jgi:hypothetical protein
MVGDVPTKIPYHQWLGDHERAELHRQAIEFSAEIDGRYGPAWREWAHSVELAQRLRRFAASPGSATDLRRCSIQRPKPETWDRLRSQLGLNLEAQ